MSDSSSASGSRPTLSRVGASAVRASAFVSKEAVEALRQPRLLLTLVLGPFLILLVFGAGLRDYDPPLRTVFVAPEDQELAREVSEFAQAQEGRLAVEGVTQDERGAMRRLRSGDVELVVVFPEDVEERVRDDEQATIRLYHNELDPVEGQAIFLFMETAVAQINQQVLASVVAEGQADSAEFERRVSDARQRVDAIEAASERDDSGTVALEVARLRADTAALVLAAGPAAAVIDGVSGRPRDREADDGTLFHAVQRFSQRVDDIEDGDDAEGSTDDLDGDLAVIEEAVGEFRALSPGVLVAPFVGETAPLDGAAVELGDYYAPAVLVVLLQHLLITLVALSIVNESELGTPELFRVSPLQTGELVLGKYLAHMLIAALVGVALLVALVFGLGVPMTGSWLMLAVVLLAVVFASAGLGFLVAGVSRTDGQAVQYTMLILLLTIFFSGFVLSLERFHASTRWVGFLVPATYGVRLLRDEMLRGSITQPLYLGVLLLIGLALALAGAFAVRLRLRPR